MSVSGLASEHLLSDPVLDQGQVVLERGAEERLAGEEHHDHLRRIPELIPVGLAGEPVHVIAHLTRVALQPCDPRFLVGGRLRLEERLERHLGVHDDLLAPGKVDDQVGPKPSVLGEQPGLLLEIAALQHARHLDDAPKLQLTPSSANSGSAQRVSQHVCRRAERDDLLGQPGIRLDAFALDIAQPLVHALQRVGNRLSIGLERCLGEIEERRTVVVERLGRQGLKGIAQSLIGLVEEGLLRRRQLRGRSGAQLRELPGGIASHDEPDNHRDCSGGDHRNEDVHRRFIVPYRLTKSVKSMTDP